MNAGEIVPRHVEVNGGVQLKECLGKGVGQPTQLAVMVAGWSVRRSAHRGGPDRQFRRLWWLRPPRCPGKKRASGFAAESPNASVSSDGTKTR